MGGGSETIRSAQVIGLSKKFGALKKKILLENGKNISSGMNMVIKSRGQSIVDIADFWKNTAPFPELSSNRPEWERNDRSGLFCDRPGRTAVGKEKPFRMFQRPFRIWMLIFLHL